MVEWRGVHKSTQEVHKKCMPQEVRRSTQKSANHHHPLQPPHFVFFFFWFIFTLSHPEVRFYFGFFFERTKDPISF